MKTRNPVAGNAWKANRSAIMKDRKKEELRRKCRKKNPPEDS